jgi:ribose-phosphate pyrophosphokinase
VSAVVFGFPGHEELARVLVARLGASSGELVSRRFPDEESYVRLATPVAGRAVVLVCGLHRADEKLLPLAFAAAAARELGAASVGIVAPYLGYMRQDARFQPGEAITSATFAKILSGFAGWLVTVDPHLHRYRALDEIYSLRASVVQAAPAISQWIRDNVPEPLIVGPDGESGQWAAEIARRAGAPCVVLEKVRHGDREVEVTVPEIEGLQAHTPVLVDDIISSGRTMIAAVRQLRRSGARAPVCVGVHAIFAGDARESLEAAGAARIATCNTIAHPTNAIDLSGLIAGAVETLSRTGPD